jgi:NADH-quinone oxidoreductase subunit H
VIGALVTALFLGGWSIPFLPQETILGAIGPHFGAGLATALCVALHVGSFLAKVVFMIWFQMLIRWTLPRFRYDQVMNLCWKILLPLSLVNIFATGFVLLWLR